MIMRADGLAPSNARPSAGTVITHFSLHMDKRLAFQKLSVDHVLLRRC